MNPSNQFALVKELADSEYKLNNFCGLKDVDEMYEYAQTFVKNLTEEEFIDFIIKSVKYVVYNSALSEQETEQILGGKKLDKFKKSIAALAAPLFLFSNLNTVDAVQADKPFAENIKSFFSKEFITDDTIKNVVKKVGCAALAASALVGSAKTYKQSDNFFQRTVIGDVDYLRQDFEPDNAVKVTINNTLIGYRYNPKQDGDLNGKCVIFYSGSGFSNVYQIQMVARAYASRGATVYGIDYSGFGSSGEEISGGKIRESQIYEDAQQIYDYVLQECSIEAKDVIIHGFSLGGPVAAHVVADLVLRGEKPHLLVLQSSMKNTANAAYNVLKNQNRNSFVTLVGSIGAYLFADQFDCERELKKIFKYCPDINICICGGNDEDHLSLSKTKLHNVADFENLMVYEGNKPHL